jgi:hypothetical protein
MYLMNFVAMLPHKTYLGWLNASINLTFDYIHFCFTLVFKMRCSLLTLRIDKCFHVFIMMFLFMIGSLFRCPTWSQITLVSTDCPLKLMSTSSSPRLTLRQDNLTCQQSYVSSGHYASESVVESCL